MNIRIAPYTAGNLLHLYEELCQKVIYIAPGVLICALSNDDHMRLLKFISNVIIDFPRFQCIILRKDLDIIETHLNDAPQTTAQTYRNSLFQQIKHCLGIVYKSEDINEAVQSQNSSIPHFELVRLMTAMDNGAFIYLTCSLESIIPMDEVKASIRATILSRGSASLTFEDSDFQVSLKAIDPRKWMY